MIWSPPEPTVLRASRFGIVAGEAECPSCSRTTTVHAVVLDGPVELTAPDGEAEILEGPLPVSHLANVSSPARDHLLRNAPSMRERPGSFRQPRSMVLVVCGHCASVVSDWHLHTEPDGPFFSPSFEHVVWIDQAIACEASYTYS